MNYLFNDTPNGGSSSSFGSITKFASPGAELLYGFNQYQANGGTMSWGEVANNYNDIIINQSFNLQTATAQLHPGVSTDDDGDSARQGMFSPFTATYHSLVL